MKFSVIVPVYNVEKYLHECVDSVLNQTYPEYEIILVDDGSTDNSKSICDHYSQLDQRIRVFHTSNSGVSTARNIGIQKAIGEYVLFLDSDDYLKTNTLFTFSRKLELFPDLDFAIGRMSYFEDEKGGISVDEFNPSQHLIDGLTGQDAFVAILKEQKRFRMGVRGFYKRSFLTDNKLFFNEEIHYSEDAEWTVRALIEAHFVVVVEEPNYCYRMKRAGSYTNTLMLSNALITIDICEQWIRLTDDYDKHLNYKFRKALIKESAKRYFNTFKKYALKLDKTDLHSFISHINKTKYIASRFPAKERLFFEIGKLVGTINLARLIKILYNFKRV